MSKTCQSLNSLNTKFQKVESEIMASGSHLLATKDYGAARKLSTPFRRAARTAPPELRPVMNTIATLTANAPSTVSGKPYSGAAWFSKNAVPLVTAGFTLSSYFVANCKAQVCAAGVAGPGIHCVSSPTGRGGG